MNEGRTPASHLNLGYEYIGRGPLALNGNKLSPLAAALSRELILLAQSSKPSAAGEDGHLLVEIKNSANPMNIESGKILYLQYQLSAEGNPQAFKFSSEPTDFWIQLVILDAFSVVIKAAKEKEQEEKFEFVLSNQDKQGVAAFEKKEFYTCLKNAKWWGQDILFRLYGGEQYQQFKDKHKLELKEETSSYVCLISQGNYLSFEKGKWKTIDLAEGSRSCPLAYVSEITPSQLKIEIWDETGFSHAVLKFSIEGAQKSARPEAVFSSVRFRTASQVTCLLGKRRVIIKQGDWLLKTATGWRNLKNLKEIESYLDYQLRGELFIFDGIEKQEGIALMKGHLIDEMRCLASSVSIPISSEKKLKTPKKKKKSLI